MAVTVTHSTVATLPDEAGAEVNKAEWNDTHVVVGLGTAAESATTDFDATGVAAAGDAAHVAAADPHTQYQKESEKDSASGYAGLSVSTKLDGTQQTYGSGANTACEGNDARLSDARTPTAHASTHQPAGSDAMAVDAAAATGSLRTIGTGALTACAGNDTRLSDARTPTAHATSHKSGGSDAIKLDEFAATTDVTTLDSSTTAHGLLRKLDGLTTTFLRGDGAWSAPTASVADPNPQSYSPGSFSVATEKYVILSRHLKLTTTQRVTLAGTATMRIS